MFRAGVALLLGFLVLAVHAMPELAQVLVEEAYRAHLEGNSSSAQTLARRALEFDDGIGDPYILIALNSPLSSAEKLRLAEAALTAKQFLKCPSDLAVRLRARILLHRDDFLQVAQFLGVREETAFHADLMAWRVHSLLALGRIQEAQNLLQSAQSRHPMAKELVPYLVRMANRHPEWEAGLNALLQQEDWWLVNKRMVLELLPLETATRASVLRFLQRRLPADPDVAALLTSMRLMSWEDAFTVWEQNGLPRLLVQTQALGNLVPQALRRRWLDLTNRQTGEFYLPSRPLSFNAEVRRYVQGRLAEVVQDVDGDGENDFVWGLEQGQPRFWKASFFQTAGHGGGKWELNWNQFPVVDRVVWNRDSELGSLRRVFDFIPAAVRLSDAALEGQLAFPGNSPSPLQTPDLASILLRAIRISDYDPDGRLRRRVRLEDGRAYLVEEDRTGKGRRDTVVFLRSGRVDRVWRDIEGTGRWNVFQRYSDGLPQEILRADNSGRTEFVWRGLEEGLFLIGEPFGAGIWSGWQQGLAQLRIQEWIQDRPPTAMPIYPQAPFNDLGEWK